jgi:hypothetical protein
MHLITQATIVVALAVIAVCSIQVAGEILETRRELMSISGTLSLWPKGWLRVPCDRPLSTTELALMAHSVRNNIQKHSLYNHEWNVEPADTTEEVITALNMLIELSPTVRRIVNE